ncbi:unnamed protein product [Rotaria sp. Silwood1]|nr:unnamed protein product [Rotaria sp. Silwood1]
MTTEQVISNATHVIVTIVANKVTNDKEKLSKEFFQLISNGSRIVSATEFCFKKISSKSWRIVSDQFNDREKLWIDIFSKLIDYPKLFVNLFNEFISNIHKRGIPLWEDISIKKNEIGFCGYRGIVQSPYLTKLIDLFYSTIRSYLSEKIEVSESENRPITLDKMPIMTELVNNNKKQQIYFVGRTNAGRLVESFT